jgi:hypothetical protein
VPTGPCAGAPRWEPIGTNRGASHGKVGYGVLSHACLMENLLRTREHGFGRLRNSLDPAGLFCFEARLFSLFLLRILRAAEFQEFSGQWW